MRGNMQIRVTHRKWRYHGPGGLKLIETPEYRRVMKKLDTLNIKSFTHKIIKYGKELIRDGLPYDEIIIKTY
jgi:hypothetical protein